MNWDPTAIHFASAWALALLLPIVVFAMLPLLRSLWRRKRRAASSLLFPSLNALPLPQSAGFLKLMSALPPALWVVSAIALTFALARPQFGSSETRRKTMGIDIQLVLDTSGSMRALDLEWRGERMSRLDVLKEVIKEFVGRRIDDRIGMVVFGTEAFIQSPLTLDHQVLDFFIDQIEIGMAGEKTAIGDGVGTAVARIKDAKIGRPIVILLTDGDNTAGKINPREAAEAAKAFGIKVYTIGLGSNSWVPMPVGNGFVDRVQVKLDEELLRHIAETSGGQYFRAKDTDDLIAVYDTIDKLEKSEIEVESFETYEERFPALAYAGAAGLLMMLVFQASRWRRLP